MNIIFDWQLCIDKMSTISLFFFLANYMLILNFIPAPQLKVESRGCLALCCVTSFTILSHDKKGEQLLSWRRQCSKKIVLQSKTAAVSKLSTPYCRFGIFNRASTPNCMIPLCLSLEDVDSMTFMRRLSRIDDRTPLSLNSVKLDQNLIRCWHFWIMLKM